MTQTQATHSSHASNLVVDGMAELLRKQALTAKIKHLSAEKRARDKAGEEQVRKVEAMRALEARNPAILSDTVRPAQAGELIGGKPAKGWVVTIVCQHGDCEAERLVNTQDAFQVRFCEAHRKVGQKAASKTRREAARDAKLSALSEEELAAEIAALEAEVA